MGPALFVMSCFEQFPLIDTTDRNKLIDKVPGPSGYKNKGEQV